MAEQSEGRHDPMNWGMRNKHVAAERSEVMNKLSVIE